MKKQRDYLTYLEDISDAITKGMSFVENITFNEFEKDEKTQFALIRAIEIIGEATKKIPAEIRNKSKNIPWREMSGMRDLLIHDYFGVNLKVIWKTAKDDLPLLKEQIIELIENFD